jgi:hypothetical protein
VKRCGKSAPRSRQRERHGKPRQEQDQIGMAHELFPARHPGRSREASGDGRPRGMVIQSARMDRTRLIGPLAHSSFRQGRQEIACDFGARATSQNVPLQQNTYKQTLSHWIRRTQLKMPLLMRRLWGVFTVVSIAGVR